MQPPWVPLRSPLYNFTLLQSPIFKTIEIQGKYKELMQYQSIAKHVESSGQGMHAIPMWFSIRRVCFGYRLYDSRLAAQQCTPRPICQRRFRSCLYRNRAKKCMFTYILHAHAVLMNECASQNVSIFRLWHPRP